MTTSKMKYSLTVMVSIIALLLLTPAIAWGESAEEVDSGETAKNSAVTIDDMTVDSSSDAATGDGDETKQETFAANGGSSGNPGLVQTIGLNALWGGLTGGLIGLGVYLLTDLSPWAIAQFAGGGILVGGTIGLIAGLTTTEPGTRALDDVDTTPASVDWVERHAPETFDLRLLDVEF